MTPYNLIRQSSIYIFELTRTTNTLVFITLAFGIFDFVRSPDPGPPIDFLGRPRQISKLSISRLVPNSLPSI